MASRPPLSRRHCSASTPPKCLPSGSVSTPLLSRACVGTASSEALAAGRRIRAAAPQTWLALRGGPDAKDLAADGGTESSNPSPSSGESGANSSQVDEVAERFRTFGLADGERS